MARNKEKLNEWNRAYYFRKKNQPDYKRRKQESSRRYYQRHKAKVLAKNKVYHRENIESYREYRRNYKCFNPRGIYSSLKSGAKKRNLKVRFTIDEFEYWWNTQKQECFYCKRSIEQIKTENDSVNNRAKRLTVDRIDNDVDYELCNIRLACYRCNSIKGDYFSEEEMLKIGDIINAKSNR